MLKKSLAVTLILLLLWLPGTVGAEEILAEPEMASSEEICEDLEVLHEESLTETGEETLADISSSGTSLDSETADDWQEKEASYEGSFVWSIQGLQLLEDYDEAIEYLYQELLKMPAKPAKIDLSRYNVPVSAMNQIMNQMFFSHPDLFIVDSNKSTYSYSGSKVRSYNPVYIENALDKLEEYNQIIDNIISNIDNDWSDLEKVLFIHDYLALHYKYDYSLTYYTAYDLFTQKIGTCEAFTLGVTALLQRINLPVSYAFSEPDNHMWNVVQLDNGKWYNLDASHDLSLWPGVAHHNHFLVSSARLQSVCPQHRDMQCRYEMNDTTYDAYFWAESENGIPFVWSGSNWYYAFYNTDNGTTTIYQWEPGTNNSTLVTELNFVWPDWEEPDFSYWKGFYSGLSYYQGMLIYNDPANFYTYDLANKQQSILFPVDTKEGYIYGSLLQDNALIYSLATSPNETGILQRIPLVDLKFSGAALVLDQDITFEFYVPIGSFIGYDPNYSGVKFSKDIYAEDGSISQQELGQMSLTEAECRGNAYVFSCSGITAKEMSADLHAALYLPGGEVAQELDYSVVDYVRDIFAEENLAAEERLKTLLVDLVNYGAAAQSYFGYNTANLANDPRFIAEEWQKYATSNEPVLNNTFSREEIEGASIHNLNLNLILDNRIEAGIQAVTKDLQASGLKMEIYNKNGKLLTSLSGAEQDFIKDFARLNCWKPQNLRDDFIIKIKTDSDGQQVSDTFKCSIEDYAAYVKDHQSEGAYSRVYELLTQMFKYADSANKYF
ncbi:MAG: transglutaminase-like domain-containing protein [Clostridia bacterium]|nr:transglutaminase-like domain-containing protein [Clostridia bacterium]